MNDYKRLTKENLCYSEWVQEGNSPSELYYVLEKIETKIEQGALIELPMGWLATLKLLVCASMCYSDILDLIKEKMSKSNDIANLFFSCPTVQGTTNDIALYNLAKSDIDCNKIMGFEEILNAMPNFSKIVKAEAEQKLKELQGE